MATWKCRNCDFKDIPLDKECPVCLRKFMPPGIILQSEKTKKTITLHISHTLGRDGLKELDPEEYVVLARCQFRISKGELSWTIEDIANAPGFPTFLDGRAIEGVIDVKNGNMISIGREHKMPMKIQFLIEE